MKKNLPAIILLVQTQGALVKDAATQVVATGQVVANEVASIGGKAVSCAAKAVQADADRLGQPERLGHGQRERQRIVQRSGHDDANHPPG